MLMNYDDDTVAKMGCCGNAEEMSKKNHGEQNLRGKILALIYLIFTFGGRLPLLILVIYTIFGGLLFRYLERSEDEERRKQYAIHSEWAVNQMLERMLEVKCLDKHLSRANISEQVKHSKDAMYWFLDFLNLTEVIAARSQETPWTMFNSMFYAGQLYTTIGYGIPITQTQEGHMASIFYILFGIPLFLVSLKQIGISLSTDLKRIFKQKIRSARKKEADKEEGEESKDVPEYVKKKQKVANKLRNLLTQIPIAFGILIFWILLSSFLFCIWETEWALSTAVYFYFVSISTVGLGDIVPTNTGMFIVNFVLIIIGLFLLSMCHNLLQTLIENVWPLLMKEFVYGMIVLEGEAAIQPADEEPSPRLPKALIDMKRRMQGVVGTAKNWAANQFAQEIAEKLETMPYLLESSDDGEERNEDDEDPLREFHPRHRFFSSASESPHASLKRMKVFKNRAALLKLQERQSASSKNDFKSLIFAKVTESKQVKEMVEENQQSKKIHKECQTEIIDYFGGPKQKNKQNDTQRPLSLLSTQTTSTDSFQMDEEVIYGTGYEEIPITDSAESNESSPMHCLLQKYLDALNSRKHSTSNLKSNVGIGSAQLEKPLEKNSLAQKNQASQMERKISHFTPSENVSPTEDISNEGLQDPFRDSTAMSASTSFGDSGVWRDPSREALMSTSTSLGESALSKKEDRKSEEKVDTVIQVNPSKHTYENV